MFDADTEEFLKALNPPTGKLYSVGLRSFQEFYRSVDSGSLKDFLDRVEADKRVPRYPNKDLCESKLGARPQ